MVSFSANDTTVEGGQERVAPAGSLGTLDGIMDRAGVLGLPVLVVGPAPVDDAGQNRRIQTLSVALGETCATHGVPFLSVIEPLLASDVWSEQVGSGDGAHPAAAGYDVLAQLVLAGGWLDWLRGESAEG